MKLLLQIFTWWNGQTIGTRFHTWRHGQRVGEDEFGNVYYQGGTDSEGRTRRWVIYNGPAEASAIPPGWHGWMHHRTDVSPPTRNMRSANGRSRTAPTRPVRPMPTGRRGRLPVPASARV